MDDRALVDALVSGDPRGLEGAYRAYADRLFTYCRGLLRDADAAADAVHDTFVLASQRAGQLRDPDKLRSWLYAVARNECLRQLRGRARQAPLEEAGQVSAAEPDPVTGLRAAELQELVWAAAEGLNPGDREVVELAVRHDLSAQEIGGMLGVSVAHAHARLSRARSQLERALGALLVARTGPAECPELAELLQGWDGRLTALMRKRVGRHIESCDTCAERQRRQLRPAALFSAYAGLPFLAVPAELLPRLELTSFDPGQAAVRDEIVRRAGRFRSRTGFPHPRDVRRRRQAVAGVSAVAVAAVLSFVVGATIPLAEPAAAPEPPDLPPVAAVSASPTTDPTPTVSPTASPTPAAPSPTPPPPGPAPGPPPPPPASPPVVGQVNVTNDAITSDEQFGCDGYSTTSGVFVRVTDADDPPGSLVVTFQYEFSRDSTLVETKTMVYDGNDTFVSTLGPFAYGPEMRFGGRFTIRVTATDPGGAPATSEPVEVALVTCPPAG